MWDGDFSDTQMRVWLAYKKKKEMSDTDPCVVEKTGLNVQEQEVALPRESKRLEIEKAVFGERMSGSLDSVFLDF